MDGDLALEEVKFDFVAILDAADGAAHDGFRRAMHADGAMRDAGNAGVADQGDLAVELFHGECSAGDKHFGHACGHRTEVAQHDDVPGLDGPFGGRIGDSFGILETDGRALEVGGLVVADFEDDAVRREVAKAHLHVGIIFEGLAERGDEVLVCRHIRG